MTGAERCGLPIGRVNLPSERHVAPAVSRVPPREATLPRGQRGSQWRQRGHTMTYAAHCAVEPINSRLGVELALRRRMARISVVNPPQTESWCSRRINRYKATRVERMLAVPAVSAEESAFAHSVIEAGHLRLERRGRFCMYRVVPGGRLFGHNPKHTTDFRTEIVAEEDDFPTLRMTVSSSILQKAQPAQQGFQLIRVTLDVFMWVCTSLNLIQHLVVHPWPIARLPANIGRTGKSVL